MHIDGMCSQQNATQMLRGNTLPIPWGNLPSRNVWHLQKIGLQIPGRESEGRVEQF